VGKPDGAPKTNGHNGLVVSLVSLGGEMWRYHSSEGLGEAVTLRYVSIVAQTSSPSRSLEGLIQRTSYQISVRGMNLCVGCYSRGTALPWDMVVRKEGACLQFQKKLFYTSTGKPG